MDHSYFKDRISAYHDRDLPPYELQVVEEHLKECAECQALLAEFEKLDRMVAEKSELADDDYWEQSAQKIEKALGFDETTEVVDIRPKSWRGLGWKIAAAAASLAVITFIGLHQGDIFKEQPPSVPSIKVDSPASKVQYMTAPPRPKMESVTDSAPSPVGIDKADVAERSGAQVTPTKADIADELGATAPPKEARVAETTEAPVQLPEAVVLEKAGPLIQSTEKDALEKTGKKGLRDTSPDLSKTKPVVIRDMISSEPATDSEVQKSIVVVERKVPAGMEGPSDHVAFEKKVDRSLATAEAVDIGAAGAAELPALRHQRDSLMALYQARYEVDTARLVEQMALAADKRMRVAKAAAPDSTGHLFEEKLVDVHYRIAQVSEDKEEKEMSIRFLRVYADRTDVPYANRARKYLESIMSDGN